MRKLSLFILALFIIQITAAQNTFQTLGIKDGLRSNSVTSLLADSHGYLWIGTYQGINRYDGYQVKTRFLESSDPQLHEVFSETTTSLEEDAAGRIWIECESGAYHIYDTQTAQFLSKPEGTLQAMGIRLKGAYKVKVGRKGALWVMTEGGINRYDYHTKELKTWERRVQLPGKTAGVVAEMSDGLYYGAGHSVWHLLTSTGELKREALPEVMERSTGEVSMLADADGTLWIYSTREESICRYIVGGRRVCEMVSLPQTSGASQNNAIRDMMDDGRGNIWVATDHKRYRGIDEQGRLFPFISTQGYNDSIKRVLRKCGITRKVNIRNSLTGENEMRPICDVASSHMARRTFVGNAYKQVKDQSIVSKMSGHAEGSKAFSRYRDIDDDTLAEVIKAMQ